MSFYLKKNALFGHIFLIIILISIVIISLFWSDSQSLIAHDEGLYARRAKLILDSGDWLSPFTSPHHKTVGSYWAIAASLKFFGISDWASRIPSTLAGLMATVLFYLIALRYFKPLNSLIGSLLLIVTPIYFQSLRTVGPDMVFITLIMAQIYFLTSAKPLSGSASYWKIFCFGVCISLAFFVRSIVALIPLVSLFPLIFVLQYMRKKEFWVWVVGGLLLGSIPLVNSLISVFGDHGYAGLASLISFASKKADMTEFNLLSSVPFYFTRLILFTFPAFVFLLPRIQSLRKVIYSAKSYSLQMELNALTVFFPLVYIIVLSFMGTRHYHYLLPLVPPLVLNTARIDLISKRSRFNFESNFAGVMCALYLLGACILCFKREGLLEASFYIGVSAAILSSALCFYAFYAKAFFWRKISPFAVVFAVLMAQYLTIFAFSASGIIWNTNKELKVLASSVNSECSFGTYLYGLSSKDMTILKFYLDDSLVLESLDSSSASPRRCLIYAKSAGKQISPNLRDRNFSKIYFR
ncbi:MAG: glycosyltransferase family 39 protein [Cyanobacteriota bacterium]|nr:glycosyltransferase family 39 protein [Cyanobacteriota bacterium]